MRRLSLRFGRQIPRPDLAQRALAHHGHDLLLHLLNARLQVDVLLRVLALARPVPHPPDHHDDYRYRHGDGEVDPYRGCHDGLAGIWITMSVGICHEPTPL